MPTDATTIKTYLSNLPADRREAMTALHKLVRDRLPKGYEEAFDFGMITWQVPLSVYPDTYNKKPLMYAAIASQKSHLAVYLCNVYGSPKLRERFETSFRAAGKKLDMGKSCVRFQRLSDVSLDAIGDAIAATPMADYVAFAKSVQAGTKTGQKKAAAAEKKAAKPAKPEAKPSAKPAAKPAKAAAKPAKVTTNASKVAAKPAKVVTAKGASKTAKATKAKKS